MGHGRGDHGNGLCLGRLDFGKPVQPGTCFLQVSFLHHALDPVVSNAEMGNVLGAEKCPYASFPQVGWGELLGHRCKLSDVGNYMQVPTFVLSHFTTCFWAQVPTST